MTDRMRTRGNPLRIPDLVQEIEVPPTHENKSNGSIVLGYTGADLTTITKTIAGVQYQKTLSYTGSDLTGVSAWVAI